MCSELPQIIKNNEILILLKHQLPRIDWPVGPNNFLMKGFFDGEFWSL